METMLTGQYTEEDWRLIALALETYVIENEVRMDLTRDQERELSTMASLVSDIETFILPVT